MDDKAAIEDLEKLTEYLYDTLSTPPPVQYLRRRKKVLLTSYIHALDLAGSIVSLLKEERVDSAAKLLRSLTEIWLNVLLVASSNDQLYTDLYLLEGEHSAGRTMRLWKNEIASDPSLPLDVKAVERGLKRNKTLINFLAKRYDNSSGEAIVTLLGKNLDLRKTESFRFGTALKGKLIDDNNNDKDRTAFATHLTLYKQLNSSVHADAKQAAANFTMTSTGMSISKHGDKRQTKMLVWTTYALLDGIALVFATHFRLPTKTELRKELAKHKDLANLKDDLLAEK